ncbi:MAG: hypothetical protein JRH20_06440 [Deltaproteobacteria bacterium]|nr:hypothetical protein [Deltaproteobacteria bacterium]
MSGSQIERQGIGGSLKALQIAEGGISSGVLMNERLVSACSKYYEE